MQDTLETVAVHVHRQRPATRQETSRTEDSTTSAGSSRSSSSRSPRSSRRGSRCRRSSSGSAARAPGRCRSIEEGLWRFEVRAIDRADNIDPTPAVHVIASRHEPAADDHRREAAADQQQPRGDLHLHGDRQHDAAAVHGVRVPDRLARSRPLARVLQPGDLHQPRERPAHHRGARDDDGDEIVDPTPARYTWTVGQRRQLRRREHHADRGRRRLGRPGQTRSRTTSSRPSSPSRPARRATRRPSRRSRSSARTRARSSASTCRPTPDSARSSPRRCASTTTVAEEGRTIVATPLAGPWKESTLTWTTSRGVHRPDTPRRPVGVETPHAEGYMEWDVLDHVEKMLDTGVNHGWQIRDAHENDPEGEAEQSFVSRETSRIRRRRRSLPQLVLRYDGDDPSAAAPPAEPPAEPVDGGLRPGRHREHAARERPHRLPRRGLVIGASNIVLDLGGHRVESDAAVHRRPGEGFSGIRISGHIERRHPQRHASRTSATASCSPAARRRRHREPPARGPPPRRASSSTTPTTAATATRSATTSSPTTARRRSPSSTTPRTGSSRTTRSSERRRRLPAHRGQRQPVRGQRDHRHPVQPEPRQRRRRDPRGLERNEFVDNYFRDTGDAGLVITGARTGTSSRATDVRNGDAGVFIQDSDRNVVIDNLAHRSRTAASCSTQGNDTVVIGQRPALQPERRRARQTRTTSSSRTTTAPTRCRTASRSATASTSSSEQHRQPDRRHRHLDRGRGFDVLGRPVGGALIEGNTTNENDERGHRGRRRRPPVRDNNAYNNAGSASRSARTPSCPASRSRHQHRTGLAAVATGERERRGPGEPVDPSDVQCSASSASEAAPPPLTPEDIVPPDTQILDRSGRPGPGGVTGQTSATFTFTGTRRHHCPPTGDDLRVPARPAAGPADPARDPDPEPPHPNEPPDIDTPDVGSWVECISPVHFPMLERASTTSRCGRSTTSENMDLTPAGTSGTIDVTLPDEPDGEDGLAARDAHRGRPDGRRRQHRRTFRFAGSDNLTPGLNLTFECRLDGAPSRFEPCTAPQELRRACAQGDAHVRGARDRPEGQRRPDAGGAHLDDRRAAGRHDAAGHVDRRPARTRSRCSTNATFTFTSDDPSATFECSLNVAPYDAGLRALHLAEGVHRRARPAAASSRSARSTRPATSTRRRRRYTWTGRLGAGARHVFCGQVITPEHHGPERPRRLPLGRPRRRRPQHHDRPRRPHDRRQGHRRRHPQRRLRQRHDPERHDRRVRLRRHAQRRHRREHRRAADGREEPGGRRRARQRAAARPDLALPLPPPPPSTFESERRSATPSATTPSLANDLGVWLDEPDAGHADHGQRASRQQQRRRLGRALARQPDREQRRSSARAARPSRSRARATTSSSTTTCRRERRRRPHRHHDGAPAPSACRRTTTASRTTRSSRAAAPRIEVMATRARDGQPAPRQRRARSNGDGISLYYARNIVDPRQRRRANKGGIALSNSSDNRLEANNASESEGTGIALAVALAQQHRC